jgi:hypothetical protein
MTEQLTAPTFVSIETFCPICNKRALVKVNRDAWILYKSGQILAQHAFPELTPSKRELLISGVCNDCFPDDPEN